MANERYNGWTNYETWLVKLWMDNDEGEQDYWRSHAEAVAKYPSYENQYMTRTDRVRHELAEMLKDYHEERAAEMVTNGGLFCDLINAALGEVDWREIAVALLDDNEIDAAYNPEEDAA